MIVRFYAEYREDYIESCEFLNSENIVVTFSRTVEKCFLYKSWNFVEKSVENRTDAVSPV